MFFEKSSAFRRQVFYKSSCFCADPFFRNGLPFLPPHFFKKLTAFRRPFFAAASAPKMGLRHRRLCAFRRQVFALSIRIYRLHIVKKFTSFTLTPCAAVGKMKKRAATAVVSVLGFTPEDVVHTKCIAKASAGCFFITRAFCPEPRAVFLRPQRKERGSS